MNRTCDNCRFGSFMDYGYSEWTVEGTSFYCTKNLHPHDGFDRFYNEAEQLKYAEKCSEFEPGEPIYLDVNGEER